MKKQTETAQINPKLLAYIPIVKGLAKALGPDYEVNLHDLGQLEHSVVAIENGHITGREIGSPMTDFGLYMMKAEEYRDKDGVYNYLAKNAKGGAMKCSCIFIRDEAGKMIGYLCINYDMTKAIAAREFISGFAELGNTAVFGAKTQDTPQLVVEEVFSHDLNEAMNDVLNNVCSKINKPLSYLSKQEKEAVIKELDGKGFFLLKGSIELLAERFGNTKFTIYSYIRRIQDEENGIVKK